MKTWSKILSTILIALLIVSITIPTIAAASSMSDIEREAAGLIGMAIQDPNNERFGFGNYTIGEAIPTYLLDGSTISEFEEAVYYPVYCDGNPIGIFTINGANTSSPTYSFGGDFIDNLNQASLNGTNAYSLVVAEHQIFAVIEDAAIEVVKFDAAPMDAEATLSDAPSVRSGSDGPADVEFVEIQDNGFQFVEYNSTDIISATVGQSMEKASNDTQSSLTLPRATRAWKGVGNVPRATQASGSNWCWAYSAWCVGEFMNGKTKDSPTYNHTVASLVAYRNKVHGSSGNSDDIIAILANKYSLPNAHSYTALTNAQMKKWLDKKQPFVMNCANTTSTGSIGHAVTCYGYDDAYAPLKIGVMDSLTADPNQYRYMTSPSSSTSTEYKITCGNYTYTYSSTVTPTLWADVQ